MTVHRAKGLEFDHVYAVNLGTARRGSASAPAFVADRLPSGRVLAAPARDRRRGSATLAHALLAALGEAREKAEAKRLFYVAVTRARESLTLSGVLEERKGGEMGKGAQGSPLGRLFGLLEAGVMEAPRGSVLVDPAPAGADDLLRPSPSTPPPAADFDPCPLPYRVQSPSAVEDETAHAQRPGGDEPDPLNRPRGIVVHRILETLARGDAPPREEAVASALLREGVPDSEVGNQAPLILAQALSAWNLPGFAALREGARCEPEFPLEDWDGDGVLRVGRLDLLLRRPDGLVVVDYKSGPPVGDPEAWVEEERRRYAPQLRAYVQMLRRLEGGDIAVRGFLLLTVLGRLVEIV